jgi:drug/metabolite transporter (DMT)-like permease
MRHGPLYLIAAALLWSLSGAFVKGPVLRALPAASAGLTIAFYRALFAALALLPLVRRRRIRWRPALVPMVVSFAAMNFLFVSAMTLTTAANAILLQYTAPLWMFLASVTLLGEPFERRSLVALGFGMAGVGVILAASLRTPEALGVVLGLASGLAYAGVAVCLRVLRDEDPTVLVVLNHAASALVLVPWVILYSPLPTPGQWATLAAFGIVQMAIPYVLFAKGLKTVSPQEAGAITLLEPILNPIWVYLVSHESVGGATFVGGVFIVAGLLSRYVPLRRSVYRLRSQRG